MPPLAGAMELGTVYFLETARATFRPKHLDRYVIEFGERHNGREADTLDMMSSVAEGMSGGRLRTRT